MRYVRQKLVQLVIVVFAVTFLTFISINLLPGDPAIFKAGPGATDAQVEQVRHDLGLDKPIPVQYLIWVKKMATLDFGVSLGFNTPVSDLVRQPLAGDARRALLLVGPVAPHRGSVRGVQRVSGRKHASIERAARSHSGCYPCRATSSAWCSSTSSR